MLSATNARASERRDGRKDGRKKVATATVTASQPQPLPPAKLPRSLLSPRSVGRSVRPSFRPPGMHPAPTDGSLSLSLSVSVRSSRRRRSTQLTASYIVSGDRGLYKVQCRRSCGVRPSLLDVYDSHYRMYLPSSKIGLAQDEFVSLVLKFLHPILHCFPRQKKVLLF